MTDPARTPPGGPDNTQADPATDPDQEPKYEEEAADATRAEHGREPGIAFSIADLVGAKVVTHDGTSRGTVTDVLVMPPPDLRVVGLVVGASGWIRRLRVAPVLRRFLEKARTIDEIPWDAVDRWDGLRVVLRGEAHTEGIAE